ncbi:Battenin [Geodia barretti]|uniref:Battenin n=1 Tax=Geodia barretti TaxID=519541 RepID=A0AA35WBH6_GEOBA|nr:Battenin [Geodia barretti]
MSSRSSSPGTPGVSETRFMEPVNGSEPGERKEGDGESKPLITSEDDSENGGEEEQESRAQKVAKWRNVTAFWLFGLCNNFPYIIMLSAAFDILSELDSNTSSDSTDEYGAVFGTDNSSIGSPGACRAVFNSTTNSSEYKARYCNTAGTSVILLADILPTLIIKLTLPYFVNFVPYWCVCLRSRGDSGCGLCQHQLRIGGNYIPQFHISLPQVYHLGLGLRHWCGWYRRGSSICRTSHVPLFLLTKPSKLLPSQNSHSSSQAEDDKTRRIKFKFINREEARYFVSHMKYIPYLVKYMMPLYLVYVSEYMINQGLFELLYYKNTRLGTICLDQKDQYRWYQVVYQLGVFISRSSLFLVYIKWFWILPILQVINFVLLFLEAIYLVLPSFWITFFLVLYEGLLGGGVYVNTFYSITKQVGGSS